MLISKRSDEFNEKRLYIFAGFDDYRIATLDATLHLTEELRASFLWRIECLVRNFINTYIEGANMRQEDVS
jgi:hypothetical protein